MNKTIHAYGLQVLIIVLSYGSLNHSAKILGVFPSPGYSQYMLAEPLLVALAEKGHSVTVISGFESKGVKNLQNIVVDFGVDDDSSCGVLFHLQKLSVFFNIDILNQMGWSFTETILANTRVQALINSKETFDLVIVETFLDEGLQTFAHHFNAHQVLFSSIAVSEWNSHLVGIPNIPSYLPITFSRSTTYMDFYERFINTLALWYDRYYKIMYSFPKHQKLVDTYFPKKYNLDDFIYNASLMLTCSHISTTQTVPLTTSVVEVGGLHIKSNKLPENIQKFLDSAEHGVIFFSMGSNIHSSCFPKRIIREIMTVFKNLKQRVLWKFEDESLKNVPDNVMVSKWFPQSDILAHPNMIAFISHCGMGSVTEAVYHGVPVIGIPMYGDQFMNLRKLAQHGMAVELPYKQLSERTLKRSIRRILHKVKYREAAKRRSKIFHDRPMKPLDEAVYWIEYVLRHDGAHHLKSSICALPWYQLYLVDVIAIIFCGLVLFSYICYILICLIRKRVEKYKAKIQ